MSRTLRQAVGLAFSAIVLAGCAHVFTLSYSPEDLNQRITPLFPLQQQQGPFTLRLTQPQVRMNSAKNRLGVQFAVDAQGLGLKAAGSTLIEGAVEYRAATRSFYVINPEVAELRIRGVPALLENSLRQAINLVAGIAMKDKPVYTLDPKNSKEALAITYLRSVRVADNRLLVDVSLTPP